MIPGRRIYAAVRAGITMKCDGEISIFFLIDRYPSPSFYTINNNMLVDAHGAVQCSDCCAFGVIADICNVYLPGDGVLHQKT